VPADLALVNGGELQAHLGTMNAEHGCWVVVRSHLGEGYAFPKGVIPVVDVEFASKTAAGPPLRRRYELNKFC
jgi:hypothetical protein